MSSFVSRSLDGAVSVLVATTLEREGFLAAFTERTGGVSSGPFDSLNLSLAVGDEQRNVRANRERVVQGLGLPAPFALPEQVHGALVADVGADRAGAGFDDLASRAAGADALAR